MASAPSLASKLRPQLQSLRQKIKEVDGVDVSLNLAVDTQRRIVLNITKGEDDDPNAIRVRYILAKSHQSDGIARRHVDELIRDWATDKHSFKKNPVNREMWQGKQTH